MYIYIMNRLFKATAYISTAFIFAFIVFKLNDWDGAGLLANIVIIMVYTLAIWGIILTAKHKTLTSSEKVFWIMSFCIVPPLAGIVFYRNVLMKRAFRTDGRFR